MTPWHVVNVLVTINVACGCTYQNIGVGSETHAMPGVFTDNQLCTVQNHWCIVPGMYYPYVILANMDP